jgi:hypothetical protein
MKKWQKILGLVLTTVLILAFYLYSLLKKVKDVVEKFQSGTGATATAPATGTDTCIRRSTTAPTDPDGLPPETTEETFTFDMFEYQNADVLQATPESAVPKWDPAGALTEFDDQAPVPWDMDNKYDDPKDILWGYVDRRCSTSLWERARMRYIYSSANNMDVDQQGNIGYWSAKFGGTLFHDPTQIAAVQFAEYLVDYGLETTFEKTYSMVSWYFYGSDIKVYYKAERAARMAVAEEVTSLKRAGKPVDYVKLQKISDEAYVAAFKQATEDTAFKAQKAALKTESSGIRYTGSLARRLIGLPDEIVERVTHYGAGKLRKLATWLGVKNMENRIPKPPKVNLGFQAEFSRVLMTAAEARRAGPKAVAFGLAKMAGTLLKVLVKAIAKILASLDILCAIISAIPAVGQTLGPVVCILGFVISIVLIAVVPQILADRADLVQDPTGEYCSKTNPVQGCDSAHPFNMQCAIVEATGPTFFEVLTNIPYFGDALYAFAPYFCSTPTLSEISWRQSFREPPYYYDSALSLYFTDKPRLLDGGANGLGGPLADPMYRSPGKFKLPDQSVAKDYYNNDKLANSYHPWVDFAHTDMLDKMANYYYSMSKRNQSFNFDGNAVFQYITNFRGCIASSQLSCDVQVELNEITYDPKTNRIISDLPVENPYESTEMLDGCTFHSRRFYFTIDYTKAFPDFNQKNENGTMKSADDIRAFFKAKTDPDGFGDINRIEAYRRMFVVIGCTTVNGTAPDVIDDTEDGDFAGEASMGLGQPDYPFLLPKTVNNEAGLVDAMLANTTNPNFPDANSDCATVSTKTRFYGLGSLATSTQGTPNARAIGYNGAQVKQSDECDYTANLYIGLEETKPLYTSYGPMKQSFPAPTTALFTDTYSTDTSTFPTTATVKGTLLGVGLIPIGLPITIGGTTFANTSPYPTASQIASKIQEAKNKIYTLSAQERFKFYKQKWIWWDWDWVEESQMTFGTPYESYSTLILQTRGQTIADDTYARVGCAAPYTYYKYYIDRWIPVPKTIVQVNSVNTVKYYFKKQVPLRWVKYNPMPLWPSMDGITPDLASIPYLAGTTKYWRVIRKSVSQKQRDWAGVQGGITAFLPLAFGFTGGFVATTLDITGAGNKLACLYQDTLKQTGDFILNGFLLTNEDHFFLIRGPAIKYAPGYRPRYTNEQKCLGVNVTQKICSDRRNIRLMAKKYREIRTGNTRRIKKITDIIPDPVAKTCNYICISVQTDSLDNTDIPQTETPTNVRVTYRVSDPVLCALTIDDISAPSVIQVNPLPYDSSSFSPPLTKTERDALAANPTNTKFKRETCTNSSVQYSSCDTDTMKEAIRQDFNSLYYSIEGDAGSPPIAQIESTGNMTQAVTPKPEDVSSGGDPVCIYYTTVKVDRGGPNPVNESQYIKFTLESKPNDPCAYRIKTHDFPRKFFLESLPKQGFLELPPLKPFQNSLKRSTCVKTAQYDPVDYSDCSGAGIMKALLDQYNKANRGKKILRVLKAYSPIVSGLKVCDYMVNMLRTSDDNRIFMTRETVRFLLEELPAATNPCGYRYSSEESYSGLNSGKTIDINSFAQDLSNNFIWYKSVMPTIMNTFNSIIKSINQYNVDTSISTATKEEKTQLTDLRARLAGDDYIRGCANLGTTCKSPEILNAFIQRWGYDNWPAYPDGQFGSVRTRVQQVRRAAKGGPTECQVELIEGQETFENFLMEPLPGTKYEFLNKRAFLRQYKYTVNVLGQEGGKCVVSVSPFTKEDIDTRTLDISGDDANMLVAETDLTLAQISAIPSYQSTTRSFKQNIISPWNEAVIRTVINSINGYMYGPGPAPTGLQSLQFQYISAAFSPRPNVIEYRAFVTETYSDPDFDVISVPDNYIVVSAEWNETKWDPIKGVFIGGSTGLVPAPTNFYAIHVNRSKLVKEGDTYTVISDGNTYRNPPYLYYDVESEVDPTKEMLRIEYPIMTPSPNSQSELKLNGRNVLVTTIGGSGNPVEFVSR